MEPDLLKLFNELYENGVAREWDGVIGRAMECMRVLGWEYMVKDSVPSYLEIKNVIEELAGMIRDLIEKGGKHPFLIGSGGFEMAFNGAELRLKFVAAEVTVHT